MHQHQCKLAFKLTSFNMCQPENHVTVLILTWKRRLFSPNHLWQ